MEVMQELLETVDIDKFICHEHVYKTNGERLPKVLIDWCFTRRRKLGGI